MNTHISFRLLPACAGLLLAAVLTAEAAPDPQFTGIQRLTNREIVFKLSVPTGTNYRVEVTTNLPSWLGLLTAQSTGLNQHTDSAAPYFPTRLYRALQLTNANALTGDHLATTNGDAIIHPINHASFVMSWNGKMIYNDPVGGSGPYAGLPKADLILVSHSHGDHFNAGTLSSVIGPNAVLIVPAAVYSSLSAGLKAAAIVLTNGATTNVMGATVEAIPAYNLTTSYHLKGSGNGYVITLGGKRIYVSGDTEDIPEMRALHDIDVAFVCINLPFTMTVMRAASAVREFRPKVVIPYHHQGNPTTDLNAFKQVVGTDLGIEVRLRKWY